LYITIQHSLSHIGRIFSPLEILFLSILSRDRSYLSNRSPANQSQKEIAPRFPSARMLINVIIRVLIVRENTSVEKSVQPKFSAKFRSFFRPIFCTVLFVVFFFEKLCCVIFL
jgi:hypothetical protein